MTVSLNILEIVDFRTKILKQIILNFFNIEFLVEILLCIPPKLSQTSQILENV